MGKVLIVGCLCVGAATARFALAQFTYKDWIDALVDSMMLSVGIIIGAWAVS